MCKTQLNWRMQAEFADGSVKTIAYGSERTAKRSAKFEADCGAIRTSVWRIWRDGTRG